MSETPNPPENTPGSTSGSENAGATPGDTISKPDAVPAATTPASPAAEALAPAPNMGDPADVEKNKVFALLSYLWILWLVPLLAAKDSKFAKYHANQGLLLFIATLIIYFGVTFVDIVLHFLPFGFLLSCISCFLYPLILLGHLALAIMGILNAVNGKMVQLPLFPKIEIIK